MIPEITVSELSEKLKSEDTFILLDVRELNELEYAKITDSRLEVTPMSRAGWEVKARTRYLNPQGHRTRPSMSCVIMESEARK